MKNKIIKPGLLLAACFVMQMTGATAASLSAAVAVEKTLPEQIQQLEGNLLKAKATLSQKLGGLKATSVKGKTLADVLAAQEAALKVAEGKIKETEPKPGRKRTAKARGEAAQRALEHKQHTDNAANLAGDIILLNQFIKGEESLIARFEERLQEKRAEFRVAEKARLERDSAAKEERRRKAEADRLQREHQADLKRQEDERRQKEEEDRQAAEAPAVRANRGATAIQSAFRGHKDRQKAGQLRVEKQDDALVRNFLSLLGGKPAALTPGSREARLASWTTGSYNVFNQTYPDYTFVKTRANADQYGDLFDLAVSYRAHNPLDSHADNNWILIARDKIDPDSNLPAAVKLVRQCNAVLDGKDVSKDVVLQAISEMAEDTLVTGGRIGIDLHRQATEAEMRVMILALRMSGQRALALAGNDVDAALAELARIYLNAAFKSEKGDTSSRVVGYPDDKLFNSHKAHCFIAATRGLGDIDDQLEAFNERLGQMGVSNVKATRAGYVDFDKE